MNQIELTSDDKEKRWKEANTPNRVSRSLQMQVAARALHLNSQPRGNTC